MSHQRTLAIGLGSKGFGFVVLEDQGFLLDWGTFRPGPGERNGDCLERSAELLDRYEPDTLVLEDCTAESSRRGDRVTELQEELVQLANSQCVQPRLCSPRSVRSFFAQYGASTKDEIAAVVAEIFPLLAARRPPRRRLWMSQDERMTIFDAAALAVTSFDLRNSEAAEAA